MAAGEVRVGDIGTLFRATILDGSTAVDVSSASPMVLTFKPPRSTSFTKATTFTTDGINGQVEYTSTGADVIDEPGSWKLQWVATLTAGTFKSDMYEFTVHKNL